MARRQSTHQSRSTDTNTFRTLLKITCSHIEERLKALDDQLPRLQAELDFLRIQNLSRDEIIAEAQDLYSRWADLLAEEKRQIVENVVERITIGKGSVSIDLSYVPSPSEVATKRQRGHIPALPFCRAHFKTKRIPVGYPIVCTTLADHLRKRILDLRINQKTAALQIGVGAASVADWLHERAAPELRRWPAVIQFLGYDPRPAPTGSGQRIKHWREARGWSRAETAQKLGIDEGTLWRWEAGHRQPTGCSGERLQLLMSRRDC